MIDLSLGISTCPNDTFIFGAAVRGDIEHNFSLTTTLDDVQYFNEHAIKGTFDVVKVSFGVFPEIRNNYKILKCGGALGFGCGPLLLSNKYTSIEQLKGKSLAIPGINTTAFMVFKKFFPECSTNTTELRFDEIMPALQSNKFDAGLVIHEGRFTYNEYGLTKVADMGDVWERAYNLPIPLGFIAIRNDKLQHADAVNKMIRDSLDYAYANKQLAYKYAQQYAIDMDIDVLKSHIDLYVNDYSYDLSKATNAISQLLNTDNSIFV